MNVGKTLFAQLMDFLPWKTFHRIVERYGGDQRVRTLSCAEQFRCMAFAQLTWRESLRDIEVCLSAQAAKLYPMGLRQPVARSTLADANEGRNWRIHADFAQVLIAQARKLYAADSFGVERSNTVYALDATTIDLCLSVFPWAPFRSTQAAIKLHTLLDLRGAIPSFIHLSDGKLHNVKAGVCAVPQPLAGGVVLSVDQAASADQAVLRHVGERGEDANLDRGVGLCAGGHRRQAAHARRFPARAATDSVGRAVRENPSATSTCVNRGSTKRDHDR